MILITGDTHAEIERFKDKRINQLKKGDTLIICGDFGFVWDGSESEQKLLKKLGRKKYNILFVEGTHDNLSLLRELPLEEWNGGMVRRVFGNLMKLERGNIYTIEGKTFFAFGGGESLDMDVRSEGVTWWNEELPTEEEITQARERLQNRQNKVDYIITHECTEQIQHFLNATSEHTNTLTKFLNEVAETVTFRRWYFGCYHRDKQISSMYHALFQSCQIIED